MWSPGLGVLAVAAFAAINCVSSTGPAGQQAAPPARLSILDRTDAPGSNYEVIFANIDFAPSAHMKPHTHPGTVIIYVLEGDFWVSVRGQTYERVEAGHSFTIPFEAVHEEKASEKGAKVLAVFTVEKGKPLTTLVP